MNSNMLKMNKNNTKLIGFSSEQHVKKTDNLHIMVGSNYIDSSLPIRNDDCAARLVICTRKKEHITLFYTCFVSYALASCTF